MPRYYFHSSDGQYVVDDEGAELPDLGAAKVEAARLMGELLKDHAIDLWSDHGLKLMVTNNAGSLLFALDLSLVEAPQLWKRSPA